MQKKIKRNIFGFILGTLIISLTTVYAVTTIQASKVTVDTTNMPNVGSNKTVQETIEYLYSKPYCPNGYKCYEKHDTLQIGDYVKMTPTLTSFTTDTTYTGYTSTQTINPSELNLWRVIRINSDGTIDMVSEYVSSTAVYFRGQTGYKNLVGYLNVLASKYENSKYTVGSRYMGYNGQTEFLTDTADTVDSTSTTAPWKSNTGSSTVESKGGGDQLHQTDITLVTNAIGMLQANKVGTTTATYYWLARRYYEYNGVYGWNYGCYIPLSSNNSLHIILYEYKSGFSTRSSGNSLRPIVTLKSGISYDSALGTSDDPFVLK